MFKVTELTVEEIADAFQILSGKRYEFLFDLEVEEDDELYGEEGVKLRVIYAVDEQKADIIKYEFLTAGNYVPFEMEPEELSYIAQLCQEQVQLESQ